jgi:hypothetical protein
MHDDVGVAEEALGLLFEMHSAGRGEGGVAECSQQGDSTA